MKACKNVFAFFLALLMCIALAAPAFAATPAKITGINTAMSFVTSGSDVINIRKAKLYKGILKTGDIYLVGVKGWNTKLYVNPSDIDKNDILSCILGLSFISNPYLTQLKNRIQSEVPKGAKIVLMGHSLGGIVCEQASADSTLKSKYEIVNTLTLGSPYIGTTGKKEGSLYRMADTADPVTYLGLSGLANLWLGNVARENSGKIGMDVHVDSYTSSSCWSKYDALGVKNGNTSIVLN